MTGPELPCWRRNGIWGRERPRCPRLEQVVHCRNCEVYIERGRALLARLAQARLSQPRPDPTPAPEPPSGRPLLLFRVNGNWLALPPRLVHRIAPRTPLRPLPHQNHTAIRGLVNVGGRLLICLSLTETLGIPRVPRQGDDPGRGVFERLVAIQHGELRFAFRAGEVHGIQRCPEHAMVGVDPEQAPAFTLGLWETEIRPHERIRCAVLDSDGVLRRVRELIG